MKARLIQLAIAACAAILLTPVLAQLRDDVPPSTSVVDLMVIEHTVEGVVERTGTLHYLGYAGDSNGAHAIACVDYVPDGDLILRDGYDQVIPSCL